MSGQYQWYNQTCSYGSGDRGVYKIGYPGAVACSSTGNDTMVMDTTIRHGNFDYINNRVLWNGTDSQSLPASLYLSSKPAFLGNSAWPVIGPDVSPMYPSVSVGARMPWYSGVLPAPYLRTP